MYRAVFFSLVIILLANGTAIVKKRFLINGNLIWFNLNDYGIDKLVAGDELVIKYTGEYEVQETYPGSVNSKKIDIKSVELIKAEIADDMIPPK